jgi:hypothetical protein
MRAALRSEGYTLAIAEMPYRIAHPSGQSSTLANTQRLSASRFLERLLHQRALLSAIVHKNKVQQPMQNRKQQQQNRARMRLAWVTRYKKKLHCTR